MTWTKLDDSWVDMPALEQLDFAARWHYLAMIQFCSRNGRYDGVIRNVDARRASDHPDPARALMEIASVPGLIAVEGSAYRLLQITEHVPAPHIIQNAEKSKLRMQRMRAHKSGDHSICLPDHCPHAPVTGSVTRNTGTGRDGTGRAEDNGGTQDSAANVTDWPVVAPGAGATA